eukprot:gene17212-23533_t
MAKLCPHLFPPGRTKLVQDTYKRRSTCIICLNIEPYPSISNTGKSSKFTRSASRLCRRRTKLGDVGRASGEDGEDELGTRSVHGDVRPSLPCSMGPSVSPTFVPHCSSVLKTLCASLRPSAPLCAPLRQKSSPMQASYTCKGFGPRASAAPVARAFFKAIPMSAPYKVLITGSTKGVGKALAEQFLTAGDSVVISSRSEERVNETVRELAEKFGQDKVHCLWKWLALLIMGRRSWEELISGSTMLDPMRTSEFG